MTRMLILLLSVFSMSLFAQNEVITEGFEGSWLPEGWSVYQNNVDTGKYWSQSTNGSAPGISAYSGSHSAYIQPSSSINGTSIDWIVSPPFIAHGNMTLNYNSRYISFNNSRSGTLKIGICPASADASNLSNYTIISTNTIPNTNWAFHVQPASDYQDEPVEWRLAFIYELSNSAGPSSAFVIDDVKIKHSCSVPYNLSAAYYSTMHSHILEWARTSTNYEYEIVPADQEPTGVGVITNSQGAMIPNLVAGAYKFYVRSICNETYSSTWAGPFYFTAMNRVTGKVSYDFNGDGDCGDGDMPIPGIEMQLTIGNRTYSVYTNEDGNYAYYYVPENVSQITFQPRPGPAFPEIPPVTREVDFSQHNFADEVDICLPQPALYKDLSVSLTPFASPRPGLQSVYLLKIQNNGTGTVSAAEASIEFNDVKLDFVSASSLNTISGNRINFLLDNILPYGNQEIYVTFQVATPPENNGGETLVFNGTVTPVQDDALPDSNAFTLNQIIVNSFDPNDITVHEGPEIYEEQIGSYLTYTIRFQNTGNADALNIYLENELDDKLDWSTFKPLASSHDYMVTRKGNNVRFTYENINLPYESADEPGSHGFVTYKIKPKNNVEVGNVIANQAKIYFDFNEPIITNEATTEVIDNLHRVDYDRTAAVSLYPNPIKDKVNITTASGTIISACVLDMNGRVCLERLVEHNTLNTVGLASGIYIIKVVTDNGSSMHKMIKE
ncbi:MAG: choice-of-anchor J domain-containing protein [Bacteroidia bacterium]